MIRKTLRILLPFALALGILWWMYRGTDWRGFFRDVASMHWGWMMFSLVFGVLAQQVRAWRWRQALEPLDEHPRRSTTEDAIFLSYATSLVVPRVGEVVRCGSLKRSDGVPFAKSFGTVLTERVVDSLMILVLTVMAMLSQVPVFVAFLHTTGTDLRGILSRFTGTGYLVTLLCIAAAVAAGVFVVKKYSERGKNLLRDLRDGILSSPAAAFLIFCVGSFAVLVPTPNGAGPWHFAVKTMLVLLYPAMITESQAILFALSVHTIQTALVALLGVYAWAHLALTSRSTQGRGGSR